LEIHTGKIHAMTDPETHMTRINYPVIVYMKEKPDITLDMEHTEYQRISASDITTFDTVPELEKSYQYATMQPTR
jgi:hypothetical protein